MGIEINEALANDSDKLHLVQQDGVKGGNVVLNVGAGLVDFVKEHHLLFDEVYYIVNVRSVATYELLFLLQNHFH